MPNVTYNIKTDLDPQTLSEAGLAIYEAWVNFAMGREVLNNFKIQNPTGKYASSIEFKQTGVAKVTIAQDENLAPEGAYLEEGTEAIDMLGPNSPWRGRRIGMHRGGVTKWGKGNKPVEMPKTKKQAFEMKHIWAEARGTSGSVLVPNSRDEVKPGLRNTSGTGPAWTIPAMPIHSPAGTLADLLARSIVLGLFK